MIMKKNLFLTAVAIMGMASCADNVLVDEQQPNGLSSSAITFENVLTEHATRAMKSSFVAGDAMGIYGFQDGNTETPVFNNQKVVCEADGQSVKWTYSPLKYWNAGSEYEFYGIHPFNSATVAKKAVFDLSTKNFAVTDYKVTDQTDIMIAEKNVAYAFNTVSMNFNHILSNVNFTARLSTEVSTTGIASIKINSFTVTGIKESGTFIQNGFGANNNVAGTWNDLNDEFNINVSNVMLSSGAAKLVDKGLMVPQPLASTLTIDYTINYKDGSATTFHKSLPLESIKAAGTAITQWNMNTVYNYAMILNPNKNPNNFDNIKIDWDGSTNGDGEPTPGSKLLGPDADGNYKVVVSDEEGHSTEYPVVWEDIDGDGRLEGGVDRDGDGHIDNVDGDTANNSDSNNPAVSDNGTNGKDVILVDTDGDGKPDSQLEKVLTHVVEPENPTQYAIDWNGSKAADGSDSSDPADETKPMPNSRLVQGADGEYYVEVDVNGDGNFNDFIGETPDTRTKVLWADLDGDGKLEGYLDNVDGDKNNNGSNPLVADSDNEHNPNGYDIILLDKSGNGTCDTQLEKKDLETVIPVVEQGTAITFNASIEEWSTNANPEVEIVDPHQ